MNRILRHGRRFSTNSFLVVSEEVREAVKSASAVVALESTVITHGLPYPDNLRAAQALEHVVREEGAVPATIALFKGRVHVGLTASELEQIASAKDAVKVSRRDLSVALARGRIGGTTVAATMFLAHRAGIDTFATGGIGGVHRGAGETFDISADLIELGRTPVVVVCAGVKSILDVRKTLEYLETQSVPVVVFGDSNVFPGFFTPTTDCKAPYSTSSIDELVEICNHSANLGLTSAPLIACPIPEEHAAVGKEIEDAIQQALSEANAKGVRSQDVTPFLLRRVNELTKGKSLIANVALLKNNASIAARLAVARSRRRPIVSSSESSLDNSRDRNQTVHASRPSVACIGATIVDFDANSKHNVQADGGTYEGTITQVCGGVGRNHADALSRLGIAVDFISVIGNDANAQFVLHYCAHMNLQHVKQLKDVPTATYLAVNVNGGVIFGIGNIQNTVARITPELVRSKESVIAAADCVLLDSNVSVETIKTAVEIATANGRPVWYEPTDVRKISKVFAADCFHLVHTISPNANEFDALCAEIGLTIPNKDILKDKEATAEFVHQHIDQLLRTLNTLVVTLGAHGVVIARRVQDNGRTRSEVTVLPSPTCPSIRSVSGAGDCLNAGLLAGRLHGLSWADTTALASRCATLSLESTHPVPATLSTVIRC